MGTYQVTTPLVAREPSKLRVAWGAPCPKRHYQICMQLNKVISRNSNIPKKRRKSGIEPIEPHGIGMNAKAPCYGLT